MGASLTMIARTGTHPAARRPATSPSARLLPFHRHGLTHVLILGGHAAERRDAALSVHAESVMRSGSFVMLDCAGEASRLSRALDAWMTDSTDSSDPSLMAAARGTLFLDRIETLSATTQRRLLMFVTERAGAMTDLDHRWGGRLICGSEADLDVLVDEGVFLLPLLDCLDKARVTLESARRGGAA